MERTLYKPMVQQEWGLLQRRRWESEGVGHLTMEELKAVLTEVQNQKATDSDGTDMKY